MTRSPALSASASDMMVSSVMGPDGTITQTTRGCRERLGESGQGWHIGDLRARVVADDFMAALAQPLAHVEAHFAQAYETKLHESALSSR